MAVNIFRVYRSNYSRGNCVVCYREMRMLSWVGMCLQNMQSYGKTTSNKKKLHWGAGKRKYRDVIDSK